MHKRLFIAVRICKIGAAEYGVRVLLDFTELQGLEGTSRDYWVQPTFICPYSAQHFKTESDSEK